MSQDAFDRVPTTVDLHALAEAQTFTIVSISSAGFGPAAHDPCNPAVRFYGAYGGVDEARAHAEALRERMPQVSLFVCETRKWILAASSPASLASSDERVQRRLEAYTARREHDVHDIEQRRTEAKEDPAPRAPPALRELESDDESDDGASEATSGFRATGPAPDLPVDRSFVPTEMRDPRQTVAVCAFVRDETNGADGPHPEFLACVYACFRSEELANAYVRNVASSEVTDVDLHIVHLHEWIFFQTFKPSLTNTHYRNKELDDIMRNAHTSEQRVRDMQRIFLAD